MRRVLCFQIEQRQILPRLPEAYHTQTGSGAHEEKARPCYAVGAKKSLIYAAFRVRKSLGRYFIPVLAKSRFYCVTFHNTAHKKDRARKSLTGFPCPVLFAPISALCYAIHSKQLLLVRLTALCSEYKKRTGTQKSYLTDRRGHIQRRYCPYPYKG